MRQKRNFLNSYSSSKHISFILTALLFFCYGKFKLPHKYPMHAALMFVSCNYEQIPTKTPEDTNYKDCFFMCPPFLISEHLGDAV